MTASAAGRPLSLVWSRGSSTVEQGTHGLTRVRHGDDTPFMRKLEILIVKLAAIDAATAGAISVFKITSLRMTDHTVEQVRANIPREREQTEVCRTGKTICRRGSMD